MNAFTSYRRPRKPTTMLVLAVASTIFASTIAQAQPSGFGNAINLGSLKNQPQGYNTWATNVLRANPIYHTYRFDVVGSQSVTLALRASTKTVAVALFDANGRFMKVAGNDSPVITHSLGQGVYYARVINTPNTVTSYRMDITARPNTIAVNSPLPPRTAPIVVNVPKPAPKPQPKPVTRIAYGGFNFENHSANTTLSPTTIGLGGTFRVTSSTMRFPTAAIGSRTIVTLVDVNRIPGSSGVTRFSLTRFATSGSTLTIAGPDLALFRNRSFYVEISTWENGQPKSYAMPGILKIQ